MRRSSCSGVVLSAFERFSAVAFAPIPPLAHASVLAYSTAGDAANGLLFGWDIADLQRWALIYLGVSSLAFVVVWVVGYLRRS
jgi:hypothetical protein